LLTGFIASLSCGELGETLRQTRWAGNLHLLKVGFEDAIAGRRPWPLPI